MPFTEANVLDAVIKISNYHELGSRLGVPPHKLADIEKSPVEDRRQLFVAALFRYTDCGWDKLNGAIKEVETQEWAARDLQRSSSMTKSTSLESDISFMSSGEGLEEVGVGGEVSSCLRAGGTAESFNCQ